MEKSARHTVPLRRIDQSITAHPNLIIRWRKIRDDIAALTVGGDALGIFSGKVSCLRDHPDPGLWPVRAGDDAANVIAVDYDILGCRQSGVHGQHKSGTDRGPKAPSCPSAAILSLRQDLFPLCLRRWQARSLFTPVG